MSKEVFETYVTIARPMAEDPGAIEAGHYVVDGDVVTLTDQQGEPISSGRLQLGYSSKMGDGESPVQVAKRLVWRHFRAKKSGCDFNRKLTYRPLGIA